MNKRALEAAALVFAAGVLALGSWFWLAQIRSVIELLNLAYG